MSYSSVVLADNPQAYYQCGELSGTTAFDSTTNHYNATYTGTFLLGQSGIISGNPSVQLDGTLGSIVLPYQLNYQTFTAFTLEYWIFIASAWQYIVLTASNSTNQTLTYLNGSIVTPIAQSTIEIGSIFDYAGSYVTVNLDEIAIYNYALTATQIQNHYNTALSINTPIALFPTIARRAGIFPPAIRRGS